MCTTTLTDLGCLAESGNRQRYLDIAAQPAIQETIARLTTIPPLPTDVALMAMPLRKEGAYSLASAVRVGV